MTTRKFTKRTAATANLDPAALAQKKTYERQRELAAAKLLKRRQKKSGQ